MVWDLGGLFILLIPFYVNMLVQFLSRSPLQPSNPFCIKHPLLAMGLPLLAMGLPLLAMEALHHHHLVTKLHLAMQLLHHRHHHPNSR